MLALAFIFGAVVWPRRRRGSRPQMIVTGNVVYERNVSSLTRPIVRKRARQKTLSHSILWNGPSYTFSFEQRASDRR